MGQRREQLNAYFAGMRATNKEMPEEIAGFTAMLHTLTADSALDKKTKELISVGIACFARCEYCIVVHAYQALKLGLTRQEIMDAGMVSVLFGGGPTISHVVTILKDCLDEFEPDFAK